MDKFIIKKAGRDIIKELNSVNFDKAYINTACGKYTGEAYKIFSLKPYEANILKQMCLSLGFDCAVSKEAVMCRCSETDCIIFGSLSQIEKLVQKLKKQPFRLKILADELSRKISFDEDTFKIRNTVFNKKNSYIMGILNVTPDSFSDGGKYFDINSALSHVNKMINEGADIIDIGGESTRPHADKVPQAEEAQRIIPVIKKIRESGIDIPVSVDTRNYKTAESAIENGADVINDVSGLDYDIDLYNFVTSNDIPVVIMHSDNVPALSKDYTASDIVDDIYSILDKKIDKLVKSGMSRNKIIADAGIGFGKSIESNFEILKRIKEFTSLKVPLLLGISRKSFMKSTFNADFGEADEITALYSAMLNDITFHRVHNTALAKKYLSYASKIV